MSILKSEFELDVYERIVSLNLTEETSKKVIDIVFWAMEKVADAGKIGWPLIELGHGSVEVGEDHPEYIHDCPNPEDEDLEVLMKFAELVAQQAIAEALVSVSHSVAAEREACAELCDRYRRLAWLVEFGEWSICKHVIKDSYGLTDDTFMDDKADMDVWLDKPEMIVDAEACRKAMEELK